MRVEQPVLVPFGGREENYEHEYAEQYARDHANHRIQTEDGSALVIVVRQLCTERIVRHDVKRLADSKQCHHAKEPPEVERLGHPTRRCIQEVESQPQRQHGSEHERVAAAPARAEIIGQGANQRVGDCIDDTRDQKHDTAQIGAHAEYLIVKHHRRDARGADGGLLKCPCRKGNLGF